MIIAAPLFESQSNPQLPKSMGRLQSERRAEILEVSASRRSARCASVALWNARSTQRCTSGLSRNCGPNHGARFAASFLDLSQIAGTELVASTLAQREKRQKSRDQQTASPASQQPQPQQVQPKGDARKEQAVAEDWEDMNTGHKLNRLRSAIDTLERRQDDLLRYVGELADAAAAMELKLRHQGADRGQDARRPREVSMTEAEHLREQAARCLRLARASTDKTVIERLTELAAEYEEQARALEGAPPGSQVSAAAPPQDQPMQQQQQVQPKDDDKRE
jgi:hypothetical protein